MGFSHRYRPVPADTNGRSAVPHGSCDTSSRGHCYEERHTGGWQDAVLLEWTRNVKPGFPLLMPHTARRQGWCLDRIGNPQPLRTSDRSSERGLALAQIVFSQEESHRTPWCSCGVWRVTHPTRLLCTSAFNTRVRPTMQNLLQGRNPFALIILGALLVGAIGIVLAVTNAEKPSDAERDKAESSSPPAAAGKPAG